MFMHLVIKGSVSLASLQTRRTFLSVLFISKIKVKQLRKREHFPERLLSLISVKVLCSVFLKLGALLNVTESKVVTHSKVIR